MNIKHPKFLQRVIFCLGILFACDLLTFLWAEGQWFAEVGYLSIFWLRLGTQGLGGALVVVISLVFLGINGSIARKNVESAQLLKGDRPNFWGSMGIAKLLSLTLLGSLCVAGLLVYQGQLVAEYWRNGFDQPLTPLVELRLGKLWQAVQMWGKQAWQLALLGGIAIAILVSPQILLGAIAVLISLGFGLLLSEHWSTLLAAFSPTAFHQTDPLFGQNISFYIFALPAWELLEFWFMGLSALALLSVSLIYLLSRDSLSQGNFTGFTDSQKRHLYGVGAVFLGVITFTNWLNRYRLLYRPDGVVFGAGYTNANIQLTTYNLLTGLGSIVALGLLWTAAAYQSPQKLNQSVRLRSAKPGLQKLSLQQIAFQKNLLPLWGVGIFLTLSILGELILPTVVQRAVVQPNELELEQPYIHHAIASTRQAFGLSDIKIETFDPNNGLTIEDLKKNSPTVENIRLWDTRPLLTTNRQLQRIRLYYEFPDADIDRYLLPTANGTIAPQQVLIAARELDYGAVPVAAQTWVNKHLIYTHGYGFTLSPVNTAREGGLPEYLVQGIEPMTIEPRIRNYIPIGKPRIYYGEMTDTYVMTQTQVKELDYPSGSDNVYSTYDGRGGVGIGNFWQRLILGKHLRDWQMILTNDFTPQTKVLFRRNINQRIRAIAPFLRYDSNPYLVVADTQGKQWQQKGTDLPNPSDVNSTDESYLYWMIDAYTMSDRYPYSDPLTHPFNYIRNSVKVVVDAYHGSVNFYVADESDPIIQTWKKVFPNVFQSLDQMPEILRQHIRYPQDLYEVQSNHLMTYHMTDPIVFYNREDQWRAPNEIYDAEQQLVKPYYLITKLPGSQQGEEFILLRLFTPAQRNNLIAWLFARSDGDQYGEMRLYTLPKQRLIYGPEQIEARINQDPIISQQISLWNRQGSRAVQGNLLVVPIERSLLYVEPLYLEAEYNKLPTLVQVIVAYRDRIVMADTLQKALEAIFRPVGEKPAIIRPVEEETFF
ncbi:MAG: UPF0182 family protein [Timaviella obliquedivisa GSE-PSE-MK23-08B]|jgi:hypothetical protein|nr:UPF0182 family protein [Timaviella obliquedivisa GSE-PSE-MK23-08B]